MTHLKSVLMVPVRSPLVLGGEIGGVAAEQRAGGVDRVTGRRAGVRSEVCAGHVEDRVCVCRRRQDKAERGDEQEDEQCASHRDSFGLNLRRWPVVGHVADAPARRRGAKPGKP
jgi:hypothetical protein